MSRRIVSLAVLLLSSSCYGVIPGQEETTGTGASEEPESKPEIKAPPTKPSTDPAPARPGGTRDDKLDHVPGLRRLTRGELINTMQDLVGIRLDRESLPADMVAEHLSNNANLARVSFGDLDLYANMAKRVAQEGLARALAPTSCMTAAASTAACTRQWVEHFLSRAFRRPPSVQEIDDYTALHGTSGDGQDRARRVIEAALLSPLFLYRTELGTSQASTEMDSYEIASRMSYLLWQSMPDDDLFAAAKAKTLATPQGRAAHVDRMLAAPRAKSAAVDFVFEWLGLHDTKLALKHPTVLKGMPANLANDMRTESARFVEHVLFKSTGTLAELLTARASFPIGATRDVYGLTAATGPDLTALPPERRGLLTQPLTLAAHTKEIGESPIQMGEFMRAVVLCKPVPPPPGDVDTNLKEEATSSMLTLRERFAVHTSDPKCAGCHALFDPQGFAFSTYDPIGRYRTTDAVGRPYDTAGVLASLDGEDRDFTSATDLIEMMAQSRDLAACFGKQLFRWNLGRLEHSDEKAAMMDLGNSLVGDGRVLAALRSMVLADSFTRLSPATRL
jgi:hypothetical protein